MGGASELSELTDYLSPCGPRLWTLGGVDGLLFCLVCLSARNLSPASVLGQGLSSPWCSWPAIPGVELPVYVWGLGGGREPPESHPSSPGIQLLKLSLRGREMLVTCPSWWDPTSFDWGLGREGADLLAPPPPESGVLWRAIGSCCSY